jgi:hypothetical protein
VHTSRCPPLASSLHTIVLPQSGDVQLAGTYTAAVPAELVFDNKRVLAFWLAFTTDVLVEVLRTGKAPIVIALRGPDTRRVLQDYDINQVNVQHADPTSEAEGSCWLWTEDLASLANTGDDSGEG